MPAAQAAAGAQEEEGAAAAPGRAACLAWAGRAAVEASVPEATEQPRRRHALRQRRPRAAFLVATPWARPLQAAAEGASTLMVRVSPPHPASSSPEANRAAANLAGQRLRARASVSREPRWG